MATYATVEYWLIIPKIIEIAMFWFLAYKFFTGKKTALYKTFALTFIVWTFYTMADLVMWITAANSETWLMIDNRIRDIQILSAVITAFLVFLDTEIIVHGYKGFNRKKIYIIFGISIIIAVFIILIDSISIFDSNDNLLDPSEWHSGEIIYVQPNISLLMVILMIYPLAIFGYSVVTLIILVKNKIEDPELKKRMYFLIIGVILIPVGILYFTTVLGIENFYNFWTAAAGRLTWICAPILIWISQQKKEKN
jgi:hypothetical protein